MDVMKFVLDTNETLLQKTHHLAFFRGATVYVTDNRIVLCRASTAVQILAFFLLWPLWILLFQGHLSKNIRSSYSYSDVRRHAELKKRMGHERFLLEFADGKKIKIWIKQASSAKFKELATRNNVMPEV